MSARTNNRRVGRTDLIMAIAILFASFLFVGEQVSEHKQLSPIDEYYYTDNLSKVLDHGPVRQGEESSQWTRQHYACDGVRIIPVAPDEKACRNPASLPDHAYPLAGGTSGDLYTPIYFGVTRVLSQPFVWAGMDLLNASRFVGAFWLGAAALVLYVALRRARVTAVAAGGIGLLLVGSGPSYWSNTYLSTDAPAMLAGATAFLLAVESAHRRRWAMYLLPVLATIATLTKLQNMIAFVAAGLFLLLVSLADDGDKEVPRAWVRRLLDQRVVVAVVAILTSCIAQLGWLSLRASMAVGPSPDHGNGVPFEPHQLLVEAGSFLNGLMSPSAPLAATGPSTALVVMVGQAVALAGIVGVAVAPGIHWKTRALGISTMLTAVLSAPALALSVVATEGFYFTLPVRYGESLVPWALACFGMLIDDTKRTIRWGVFIIGALVWALSLSFGETL